MHENFRQGDVSEADLILKKEQETEREAKDKISAPHRDYQGKKIYELEPKVKLIKEEEQCKLRETEEMRRQSKKLEMGYDEKLLANLKEEEGKQLVQDTERLCCSHQNVIFEDADTKLSLTRQKERRQIADHEAMATMRRHSPTHGAHGPETLQSSISDKNSKQASFSSGKKSKDERHVQLQQSTGSQATLCTSTLYRHSSVGTASLKGAASGLMAAEFKSVENIKTQEVIDVNIQPIRSRRSVFGGRYATKAHGKVNSNADPPSTNTTTTSYTITREDPRGEHKNDISDQRRVFVKAQTRAATDVRVCKSDKNGALRTAVADSSKPPKPQTSKFEVTKDKNRDTRESETRPKQERCEASMRRKAQKQERRERRRKALIRKKLREELPPLESIPKIGEPQEIPTILPEEEKGHEILATNAYSIIRLEVLFSFGLLTSSDRADFSNYLNAVETIVMHTCARDPTLTKLVWYDPAYPVYVKQSKTDGKCKASTETRTHLVIKRFRSLSVFCASESYSHPSGRKDVQRLLVISAIPVFLKKGISIRQTRLAICQSVQAAMVSGEFIQLVKST